ncbi:MAG: flagellar basal-body MS-ring/collar protein FliF [Chlamydiales bacterium]
MKEILSQFLSAWREISAFQKMAAMSVLLIVSLALGYLLLKPSSSTYIPLFPNARLQSSEISKIRAYLDRISVPFKEKKEKGILVSEEYVDQIRAELNASGLLDHDQGKGFELFDTNTWIKGDKELQVLEMRALKGQLEKDLTAFDQIKNASVILDLAPPRPFRESQYKTKASVILTLMPGARLSTSQLRAITYHLAGAVRGLEPHSIAISDTTGKLYKAISPDGEEESLNDAKILFEEEIQAKIDGMLSKIVGKDHFYSTIQTISDSSHNEIQSLSVALVIDQSAFNDLNFKEELHRQISTMIKGQGIDLELAIDFLPFEKKRSIWVEKTKTRSYAKFVLLLLLPLLVFLCLSPFLRRATKKKKEDDLFRLMTRIDSRKLAELIQGEAPASIALMLSYLEPSRAEKIMEAFPEHLKEELVFHLTELEKEEQ